MSGFAKFTRTKSYLPLEMASSAGSATARAAISGFLSYVATSLGDANIFRSSPSKASSRPPLKKYVTCAYFSVSAHRNCLSFELERISGKMFGYESFGKATGRPRDESYVVMHV